MTTPPAPPTPGGGALAGLLEVIEHRGAERLAKRGGGQVGALGGVELALGAERRAAIEERGAGRGNEAARAGPALTRGPGDPPAPPKLSGNSPQRLICLILWSVVAQAISLSGCLASVSRAARQCLCLTPSMVAQQSESTPQAPDKGAPPEPPKGESPPLPAAPASPAAPP